MDYFFAGQLRQYRLQFIRAFSNFKVDVGPPGSPLLKRVPCRYGDASRIASMIVAGNSENKSPTTPFISCMINNIAMAPNRRQDPMLVEKVQVNEREYDEENQRYTQDLGNRYTLERYMPVPYDLTMQVDIWTSNENIKEQLIEQILMLYNPSIDFQTSNNPLDWTFLSYIEMQENITWSSRSIPIGTENPIDVLSMTFKVPIFINPPAKVKRQSIIEEIITDIVQARREDFEWEWSEYEFLSRTITTPGNYSIELSYSGDTTYEIRLLTEAGSPIDPDKLATVTDGKVNPVLVPGTSFNFNGIKLEVNTSNVSTFVDNARIVLANTPYSIQLHNKNYLRFINNTGGDNIFSDDVGQALNGIGLLSTTYPGGNLAWWRLLEAYGTVKTYNDIASNASQLRIKKDPDLDSNQNDIVGWISYHPVDQNRIYWKIDTQSFPQMTLPPINAIIDPTQKGPNNGLPSPVIGQRYLLIEKVPTGSAAWGNVVADSDDIIEYTSTGWKVSFLAKSSQNTDQLVTNMFTGKIYAWDNNEWSLYIDQMYKPGYWRLSL